MSGTAGTVSNPLIAQGQLNRLRAAVTIPSYASLNISASYLAKAGINLRLEGNSVEYLDTMTAGVPSLEPYMKFSADIALVKSQNLANSWKTQLETMALIGDITMIPDATTLGNFQFTNCAIQTVGNMSFAGNDAAFTITLGGYYLINNNAWNLQ